MKTKLLLPLLFAATFALALASDLQSWTASDGRVMQAKFIKLDGESVIIEKDGKEFAVPLAKLAPASVEQAKKLGGVKPVVADTPATPPPPQVQSGPLQPTGIDTKPDAPLTEPALSDWSAKDWATKVWLSVNLDDFKITPHGHVLVQLSADNGVGLLMLSGSDGKPLWSTTPAQLQLRGSYGSTMVNTADDVFIVSGTQHGLSQYIKDKACLGSDVTLASASLKDGAVRWTQTYKGPQKGHDAVGKVIVDGQGNLVVTVKSSAPRAPDPKKPDKIESPYQSTDTLVARFSATDGKLMAEGKALAKPDKHDSIHGLVAAPDGRLMVWRKGADRMSNGNYGTGLRLTNLVAYDLEKDSIIWEQELGEMDSACSVIADQTGNLVAPARYGSQGAAFLAMNLTSDGKRQMDLNLTDLMATRKNMKKMSNGESFVSSTEGRFQEVAALGETQFCVSAPSTADESLHLRCYDRRTGELQWQWQKLLLPVSKVNNKSMYHHVLLSGAGPSLYLGWVQPSPEGPRIAMAKFSAQGHLLWTRELATAAYSSWASSISSLHVYLKLDPAGNPVLFTDRIIPETGKDAAPIPPEKQFDQRNAWSLAKFDQSTGKPLWQVTRKVVVAMGKYDSGYQTSFTTDDQGNVFHFWAMQGEEAIRVTKHSAKDGSVVWETKLQP